MEVWKEVPELPWLAVVGPLWKWHNIFLSLGAHTLLLPGFTQVLGLSVWHMSLWGNTERLPEGSALALLGDSL